MTGLQAPRVATAAAPDAPDRILPARGELWGARPGHHAAGGLGSVSPHASPAAPCRWWCWRRSDPSPPWGPPRRRLDTPTPTAPRVYCARLVPISPRAHTPPLHTLPLAPHPRTGPPGSPGEGAHRPLPQPGGGTLHSKVTTLWSPSAGGHTGHLSCSGQTRGPSQVQTAESHAGAHAPGPCPESVVSQRPLCS